MSTNPNTVKSQDDINEGGRKSDVLIEAISKAERLQKQLDIAVKALEEYADEKSWFLNDWEDREDCVFNGTNFYMEGGFEIAQKALKEIKELNNVSR